MFMTMATLQLDAELLHFAVINACRTLIAQRANLNAINLFPVPDGDTGDNMAATARAILHYATVQDTLVATCQSLADASIMGARGNSGMIFSQFFNGLLEGCPQATGLTTIQFAEMVAIACASVRAAIVKPVEGTIITVMDAWAKALQGLAEEYSCFVELLGKALPEVQTALQSTTMTLAILQEAHVVDAGALGFSLFVEGFTHYISHPQTLNSSPTAEEIIPEQEHEHEHELPACGHPPENRYCTEAVIRGEKIDRAQLGGILQAHGDSIVLTANQQLCRLHLHCNQPAGVFEQLKAFGTIQYPKVDDMLRQYQVAHERRHPIALVTDSSVNIPQSILDDYQVHLISLNVHCDGHDLLDRHCFDSNNFYDNLAELESYPTTSFPSPGLIAEKIAYLSQHFQHVLVLSVARVLSGTHDAFAKAAANHSNVHVIDSRLVSGAQGLLLYYAAELIAEGQDIESIKKAVTQRAGKTQLLVVVDQFDSMIRSGRISRFKGRFAQLSGVKPIISLNEEGRAVVFDKAFSETKALVKVVNSICARMQKESLDNYCIIHAGAPEKARDFAKMTTEAFGQEPVFIEPVSTVIGLHAGKGCVAVAAMFRD